LIITERWHIIIIDPWLFTQILKKSKLFQKFQTFLKKHKLQVALELLLSSDDNDDAVECLKSLLERNHVDYSLWCFDLFVERFCYCSNDEKEL